MRKREGKWQAFDSLTGFRAALLQTENNYHKIKQAELCEDQIYEIEYLLKTFHENKKQVEITYFLNGQYHRLIGLIDKLDYMNKQVVLNKQILKMDSIYKIIEKG